MVTSTLHGRKTQTRRTNGLEMVNERPDYWRYDGTNIHGDHLFFDCAAAASGHDFQDCVKVLRCPYGQPGDRLWVKETFCSGLGLNIARPEDGVTATGEPAPRWIYRADGAYELPKGTHWRPSIFMPRQASRITLEITDVRVERLQDIGHRDALAEGVEYDVSKRDGAPLARFQALWKSINGKGSWDANPWVWVLSFKRITP